jgi:hypothetical protein
MPKNINKIYKAFVLLIIMKKLCKILTEKFNIQEPKNFIEEIKETGYKTNNYRFLEKVFLELPFDKFDKKIYNFTFI